MRLHAPGTFITDPLFYIPQKEKIAPNIAAKIVRVNGPSQSRKGDLHYTSFARAGEANL